MSTPQLVEHLNDDLAVKLGQWAACLSFSARAATSTDSWLELLYINTMDDLAAHARSLATMIIGLGGVPTTVAQHVEMRGRNRDMLQGLLASCEVSLRRHMLHRDEAERMGEQRIANELQRLIREEGAHVGILMDILAHWPLDTDGDFPDMTEFRTAPPVNAPQPG